MLQALYLFADADVNGHGPVISDYVPYAGLVLLAIIVVLLVRIHARLKDILMEADTIEEVMRQEISKH